MTERFAAIDPATGEEWATHRTASDDEIEAGIAKAAAACVSWGRTTTAGERAAPRAGLGARP